jgi:hypothetical protein
MVDQWEYGTGKRQEFYDPADVIFFFRNAFVAGTLRGGSGGVSSGAPDAQATGVAVQ